MKILLLILCQLVILSCNETQQNLKDDLYYDRDISVNEYKVPGVAILPRADKYTIKLKSFPKINFGTLTTCHREVNFWNDKNEIVLEYTPIKGIEDSNCDVSIMVAQKGDNQNLFAWGHISFEDPQYKLKAQLSCNGIQEERIGQTICKFKKGLIQQIKFGLPVEINPLAKCPLPTSKDQMTWQFSELPVGLCNYLFKDKILGQIHKLTTISWENILIRR